MRLKEKMVNFMINGVNLKVNIDEEPDIASNLGVMSIPTLILYKDGEKVDSINGFAPKEKIEEMIEKHK